MLQHPQFASAGFDAVVFCEIGGRYPGELSAFAFAVPGRSAGLQILSPIDYVQEAKGASCYMYR